MDIKRSAYIHAGGEAEVVSLTKYKKKLVSLAKPKRRRRAARMATLCCEKCGHTDFKFVLECDVAEHAYSIMCVGCLTKPSPAMQQSIFELLTTPRK